MGNLLVDDQQLTLIDHGYAFAQPEDFPGVSMLVRIRAAGRAELDDAELGATSRLLDSPDLLGMACILEPDRAEAMRARDRRMRESGRILPAGDF